jgi:hypothetical protein
MLLLQAHQLLILFFSLRNSLQGRWLKSFRSACKDVAVAAVGEPQLAWSVTLPARPLPHFGEF